MPPSKGKNKNSLGQRQRHSRRVRDGPASDPATAQCMMALGLMAVSGFSRGKILENTCLELSNACREGAPWSIRIQRNNMPPFLERQFWPPKASKTSKASRKLAKQALSRLKDPSPKVSPMVSRLLERRVIKRLVVVRLCNASDIIWPPGVEKVEFCKFDSAIEHVAWPATLTEIKFIGRFNHDIEEANWPLGLRVLQLSNRFDRPVQLMRLPDGLERIEFGDHFDQPIAAVKWPPRLKVLEFGELFNRPLNGVTWPKTLKNMSFSGPHFNQPIHDSPLPRDLEVLELGDGFDQPLQDVKWPAGLREVNLGRSFLHNLEGVEWPKTLQRITAPDIDLGTLPTSCIVSNLRDLEDEIEDDVASIMSHFMMTGGFFNPFDPFLGNNDTNGLDYYDDGFSWY